MPITFPNHDDASRRYGQVFLTLTRRLVDTNSFRRLMMIGLPQGEEQLRRQFLSFVADLAAGPEFNKYFADRDAALAHFGGVEGMALSMAAD